MRIGAITLADVRQFTTPVRIAGFDRGLNVLSAPNEAGKSTVFDAILAVFFVPHRSKGVQIKALRPAVGGNPAITVELEEGGAAYRIEKVWFKGEKAEIFKDGQLIAKSDEAEAWIERLIMPAEAGGPAGLIWVRQGITTFDDGSKKEIEAAQVARRDLLSSVTGAVESMTGGRQMDRALARAQAELDALVTSRGARAGGALDEARKLRDGLVAVRAVRAESSALLQKDLARRRAVLAELRMLTEPEAVAQRMRRLEDAQAAEQAGQRHAQALEGAQLQLDRAELQLMQARRVLEAHDAAHHAAAEAERLAGHSSTQAAAAVARLQDADAVEAEARAKIVALRAALRKADADLEAALKAQAAEAAAQRRADLEGRIAAVAQIEAGLPTLKAAAKGPDRKQLDTLEKAAQEVVLLERMQEAGAAHFAIVHSGTARALMDGKPLEDGRDMPLVAPITVQLPGFGALRLRPGEADQGKLEAARAKLASLLAAFGVPSVAQAREVVAQREAADQALRDAMMEIRVSAPSGVMALSLELAGLPEQVQEGPVVVLAEAEQAVASARAALAAAEVQVQSVQAVLADARDAQVRAVVAEERAQEAVLRARAGVAGLEATPRTELAQSVARLTGEVADLAARREAMGRDAPDLAALAAALARAKSVQAGAEKAITDLRVEHAALDARIAIHAGQGVEEELADTEARLTAAEAEVAAWEREVAVLRALVAVLEQAKAAARDRYFDPVMVELRPMLRLLWPDAELRFDAESLLPTHLIRDGRAEEIGTLSGGTREQIALLVRLAFARLLAKAGRHAPVILDDALVYTDDDRIERMFDALHVQAADLQIIVLSCRSRVFRDLGGQKLVLGPVVP